MGLYIDKRELKIAAVGMSVGLAIAAVLMGSAVFWFWLLDGHPTAIVAAILTVMPIALLAVSVKRS